MTQTKLQLMRENKEWSIRELAAPQSRKTYEYKNIAQALKGLVDELVEEQIDDKIHR